MNYSDFPTKNKRRQQRRKMKQRSLHAKALHEGRNGQYRHRVFSSDNVKRINSHDLLKEWFDEEQEKGDRQRYKQKLKEDNNSTDSSSDEDGHGRCSRELVESSDGPDREGNQE